MWTFLGAASAMAIVRATCPRCGEVQARKRPAPNEPQTIACRRCKATFALPPAGES